MRKTKRRRARENINLSPTILHLKNIKRVLLKGEGKAFCAGGDVKSVFLSSKISDLKKKFFFQEYKLNYAISQFNKPYLSIWNGIVMGGGVGLSIYGSARIATEKTKFAMPETAIGFFPDVGGSYFLTKIIRNVGLYLGLTGQVMNFEEVVFFDLATHYFNSEKIEKVTSLPKVASTEMPIDDENLLIGLEKINWFFH